MQTYKHREKGFEVQAETLTAENVQELAELCGGLAVVEHDPLVVGRSYPAINVPTPEGMRRLQEGFVLIVVDGQFWVGRPGVFDRTYEAVISAEV